MPAIPETARSRVKVSDSPEPLRRKRIQPAQQYTVWRKALNFLLVFATVVLLADALVGERGLVATTRARRESQELTGSVQRLRDENRHLRESARRLREDGTTIEEVARRELGLIRQGEVLVILRDIDRVSK